MRTRIENRLPLVLLLLRLSVALVFFVWIADKFFKPDHAAAVFANFYGLSGLGTIVFYLIGIVQLLITLAFVLGIAKPWSYGLILGMHGVSTLSSFRQYLNPLEPPNILFFAAWPMFAACFALFYLREADVAWTIGGKK